MPLPSLIQAIQARFRGTNNNAWNATTNPLGMGQGGHRQNMPPRLNDIADVLSWQAESFDAIASARALTAQDASNTGLDRIATAQNVLVAAKWAANGEDQVVSGGFFSAFHYMRKALAAAASAAAYAAGLNLPAITSADAGKVLAVKPDGSGYVTTFMGRLTRVARTGNVQILSEDRSKFIDITSGTFTQTFASAVALGDGFFCYLRNSGDGDVTLDPEGSEIIDGLATFIMYPGEVRLIQCDGAQLRSIMVSPGVKVFTSSGNFTWPPGITGAVVDVEAGGGGGGRSNGGTGSGNYGGGGGGGGGRNQAVVATRGAGVVTGVGVGSGGLGATTAGANGLSGGDSGFGAFVYARGGTGGGATQFGGNGGAAGGVAFVDSTGLASGSTGGRGGTSSSSGGNSDRGGGGGGNTGVTAAGTNGGSSQSGGGGGGGGGGPSNSSNGGFGGGVGGFSGVAGGTGSAGGTGPIIGNNGVTNPDGLGGSGGGGGGGSSSNSGGRGGDGAFPSGGGGGGGGGISCGVGGNGAAGRVIVRMF